MTTPARKPHLRIDAPRLNASAFASAKLFAARAARIVRSNLSATKLDRLLASQLAHAAACCDAPVLARLAPLPKARESSRDAMQSALDTARAGELSALELLLKLGFDPELPEMASVPDSPLARAINDGQLALAKTLAPHSRIDRANDVGRTPLLLACARMPELVDSLLACLASLRACDIYGLGPLETAAIAGRIELVESLVALGARLVDPNGSSATALAVAAMLGHESCALSLARLGAGLGGQASWRAAGNSCQVAILGPSAQSARQTPAFSMLASTLHWAAYLGFESLLELSSARPERFDIDEPAPLNAPKNRFAAFIRAKEHSPLTWWPMRFTPIPPLTPLALAAMGGHLRCAQTLAERGASLSQAIAGSVFQSLPEIAARHAGASAAPSLAAAFPLDDIQSAALWRAAPDAAAACRAALPASRLEERVDGLTIFLRACEIGAQAEALSQLAAMGADIQARSTAQDDKDSFLTRPAGMGALALACSAGAKPSCVKTLLAMGLDPLARASDGHLPIEIVRIGMGRSMLAAPAENFSDTAFSLLAEAMLARPEGPSALVELIDQSAAAGNIFHDPAPYAELRARAASSIERRELAAGSPAASAESASSRRL